MKLNVLLLVAAASMVAAKNVYKLEDLKSGVEGEKDRIGHQKREPKNVHKFSDQPLNEKREAKNVYKFKDEPLNEKREAKNVYKFKDEPLNEKREAKNVYKFKDESLIGKREAKNVYKFKDEPLNEKRKNIHSFKVVNEKRDAKNLFDLTAFKNSHQSNQDKRGNEPQVLFSISEKDCHQNLLQSILPQLRDISIFTEYIRDNKDLMSKTEWVNETMVVIAPTNNAISHKLSGLKPWEFPQSLDQPGQNDDEVLESNLASFLNHHVAVRFEDNLKIDKEGQYVVAKLASGQSIRIRQAKATGEFSVQLEEGDSDWIKVTNVKQADNGFVFVIDDVLVKPAKV